MTTAIEPEERIDVEELASELEDDESSINPSEYSISVYPSDFTLQGLYDKWRAKSVRLPEFQRQYVWSITRASQLIESFLLGLPVPGVFFYKERTTQHHLVIDGQQRLRSVFFFFDGIFADGRPFRLTGLKTRWNGYGFDDLMEPDQLRLQDAVLRATIVNQIYPEDNTSIYHIFERLNTTSTPLSNQEIRNCIYHGEFNTLLQDINQSDSNWRAILGKSQIDSRQRDVELILRFFALHEQLEDYKEPMKDFLNSYMGKRRNPDEAYLERLRDIFTNTTQMVVSQLGEKPFHVKAGLNAAVFDSVLVAASKHLDNVPTDLKDRYECLKSSKDFAVVTSSSTTHAENVRRRLEIAEGALFGA